MNGHGNSHYAGGIHAVRALLERTPEGVLELWAWSPEFGQGYLGPIDLVPSGARGLEVELTEEPGHIRGRVLHSRSLVQ